MSKIDFNKVRVEYRQVTESDLQDDDFESDVDEFTQYYQMDCLQDVRELLAHMYVIHIDDKIMGYVTLAIAHLENNITPKIKSKEVNSNIPALLISHLAVRKGYERRGIGTHLMGMILGTVIPKLMPHVGCRYVILKPRNDKGVRNFYTRLGFEYVSSQDTKRTFRPSNYGRFRNVLRSFLRTLCPEPQNDDMRDFFYYDLKTLNQNSKIRASSSSP